MCFRCGAPKFYNHCDHWKRKHNKGRENRARSILEARRGGVLMVDYCGRSYDIDLTDNYYYARTIFQPLFLQMFLEFGELMNEYFIYYVRTGLLILGNNIKYLGINADDDIVKGLLNSLVYYAVRDGVETVKYILEVDCYICAGYGIALSYETRAFDQGGRWMRDLVDVNVSRINTYVPFLWMTEHDDEFSYVDSEQVCFYHMRRNNEHSHLRYFNKNWKINFMRRIVNPLILYHLEATAKIVTDQNTGRDFCYSRYLCRPLSLYLEPDFYRCDDGDLTLRCYQTVFLFLMYVTGKIEVEYASIKHSKERSVYMMKVHIQLCKMESKFKDEAVIFKYIDDMIRSAGDRNL
jgi:hypothetical protein